MRFVWAHLIWNVPPSSAAKGFFTFGSSALIPVTSPTVDATYFDALEPFPARGYSVSSRHSTAGGFPNNYRWKKKKQKKKSRKASSVRTSSNALSSGLPEVCQKYRLEWSRRFAINEISLLTTSRGDKQLLRTERRPHGNGLARDVIARALEMKCACRLAVLHETDDALIRLISPSRFRDWFREERRVSRIRVQLALLPFLFFVFYFLAKYSRKLAAFACAPTWHSSSFRGLLLPSDRGCHSYVLARHGASSAIRVIRRGTWIYLTRITSRVRTSHVLATRTVYYNRVCARATYACARISRPRIISP